MTLTHGLTSRCLSLWDEGDAKWARVIVSGCLERCTDPRHERGRRSLGTASASGSVGRHPLHKPLQPRLVPPLHSVTLFLRVCTLPPLASSLLEDRRLCLFACRPRCYHQAFLFCPTPEHLLCAWSWSGHRDADKQAMACHRCHKGSIRSLIIYLINKPTRGITLQRNGAPWGL